MQADKIAISRLLKTAKGQIEGILKMVEDDRYCIDISNQLSATESILRKANREILRAHLEHCVKDALTSGDEAQKEKIDEVISSIEKMVK